MKSKMKSSVKEKLDNDARRKVGKIYGFKQHSWCNWIIKDGYFFYIMHGTFTKEADLYVKPCYYDDVFYPITPVAKELEKLPTSYRAVGGIQAPDFEIVRNFVPLEDDADFTEENCTAVWHTVFNKVLAQIDDFLQKNPNVDDFTIVGNNSVRQPKDDSFARMLEMIYHKQYKEAGDIAEDLLNHGKKGSYAWGNSVKMVYINELILDYCRKRQ